MMAFAVAPSADAQAVAPQAPSPAPRTVFTGTYAGPEIGAHEHHFYIEQIGPGVTTGRYYRAWGVGGGAFLGHDFALTSRLRIGIEAGASVGGSAPVARFANGTSFSMTPQLGYRATAKVAYVLGDEVLAYGTLGYGGHRYRIANTAQVSDARNWNSSFTIGAGVEYRASDTVGVRLDFRHLDNSMSHILVGVPVRF